MTPSHNHVGLSDGHLASLCHVEKLLLARNTITHTHNIGIPGKFGEQRLRKVIERSAKSSPPASHCATSQDWDSRPETAHSTLSSIAFSLPWFTHVKRFTGNTKPFSPCWWWNLLRIGSHQRLGYALYPTPHMRERRLSRISDWRKAYHRLLMRREGKWLRNKPSMGGETVNPLVPLKITSGSRANVVPFRWRLRRSPLLERPPSPPMTFPSTCFSHLSLMP